MPPKRAVQIIGQPFSSCRPDSTISLDRLVVRVGLRVNRSRAARRVLSKWRRRLLDHLVPGDHIGLVTFASKPRLDAPVVELTEARRYALRGLVTELRADGSTNLAGGLVSGVKALRDAALPPAMRAGVILLTDGDANEGPAQSHEALAALVGECAVGVSESAFGYGDDCEHTTLAGMAAAGGGSFAYIASDDAVMTAFSHELGGLLATYAADLRLEIVPAAGGASAVSLGDFLHQGECAHLVEVAVGGHGCADRVEILQVRATWRDALGGEQRAVAPSGSRSSPAGTRTRSSCPATGIACGTTAVVACAGALAAR